MRKQKIFMFSGQGSQYYTMGKELYEQHEVFKYWMDTCDGIVAPLIGKSLIDILYKEAKKGSQFDRLLYTNPALLSIQYSLNKVLNAMDIYPDYLLGYSLGEITAAVVSEAISLEDGLTLVVEMANMVEEKTPQAAMLAIVSEKSILLDNQELFEKCWITGTNFSENFVVSGLLPNIQFLKKKLLEQGVTTQILPVNYGFHTPLINDIEAPLKHVLNRITIKEPQIPIISSKETIVREKLTANSLWEVLRHSVNFELTVKNVLQKEEAVFIDVGPSGSLATAVKYILEPDSTSVPLQIMNQFGSNLKTLEKFSDMLREIDVEPVA